MRGFRKGMTLGGRTSGSALKVVGGVGIGLSCAGIGLSCGGLLDFSVPQVQVLDFALSL